MPMFKRRKKMRKSCSEYRSSSRIGIPRALYYFYYPELWESFFGSLGFVPVVSGETTKETVVRASRISEAEHCLPMKLFDAHFAELVGRVDMIFVPRTFSTMGGHLSCPKLSVLPDVAVLENGVKVLTIDIDEREQAIEKSLVLLGKMLGVDKKLARSAAFQAKEKMLEVLARRIMVRTIRARFLILGHPYILYDDFISGQILRKLGKLGVYVEPITFCDQSVSESFVKWDTSSKMYEKVRLLDSDEYSAVIQISAFNCGCDSIMTEMFRRVAREKEIPYMILVIDEHMAQAGIDTRLEAFVDSVRWRHDADSRT